jgi:hypothetical protein
MSQVFRPQKRRKVPRRGSIQVCLDGKTLRGTIPAGQSQGVHLMAAYLPKQGVVLMQMEVGEKTNEITVARHPWCKRSICAEWSSPAMPCKRSVN